MMINAFVERKLNSPCVRYIVVLAYNFQFLRSRYCTIEASKLTTDRHEASRGLFATAELLVNNNNF